MKIIKKTVNREYLVNKRSVKDERLSNGQSITKAILMGGKNWTTDRKSVV